MSAKTWTTKKIWWKLTILCQLWWSFAFFSHSFWRWLGIHHFEKGTEKCTRSSTKCSLHLESRCSCCNWNSWNIGKNRYGYRSLPIYSSSSFFGSSTVHNLLPWNSAVHKPFQTFPDSRTSSRLIHYDSDERRGRNSWNWCIQCIPQKSCLIWGLGLNENIPPCVFSQCFRCGISSRPAICVKALLSLAMTSVWKSTAGFIDQSLPSNRENPGWVWDFFILGSLESERWISQYATISGWNSMKQHVKSPMFDCSHLFTPPRSRGSRCQVLNTWLCFEAKMRRCRKSMGRRHSFGWKMMKDVKHLAAC